MNVRVSKTNFRELIFELEMYLEVNYNLRQNYNVINCSRRAKSVSEDGPFFYN